MRVTDGQLYDDVTEALADLRPGETPDDVVQVIGSPGSVRFVSDAVREKRRRQAKAARKARRAGRR